MLLSVCSNVPSKLSAPAEFVRSRKYKQSILTMSHRKAICPIYCDPQWVRIFHGSPNGGRFKSQCCFYPLIQLPNSCSYPSEYILIVSIYVFSVESTSNIFLSRMKRLVYFFGSFRVRCNRERFTFCVGSTRLTKVRKISLIITYSISVLSTKDE